MQRYFGATNSHDFDMMSLDSNAQRDKKGTHGGILRPTLLLSRRVSMSSIKTSLFTMVTVLTPTCFHYSH